MNESRTTLRATATSGTAPDAERRQRADPEERRSFRRAMGLGLVVWPSFFFVDQYIGRVVYPGAPLLVFFGFRVLGQLAIFGMYRLSYREAVSSTQLKLANALVCGLAAVFISIMATWYGGLASPYLHGTALVIMVLALAVPAPWRDTAWYAGSVALSFPVVYLLMAPFRPELARALADPEQIALFFAHYSIMLGAAIIATVGGQLTWSARQQLRKARRLGRYRLEARIGEGGMNEVWHAFDPSLGRDVALKILRAEADADPRVLARFEREARALSQLTSEHTVRVYDFGAGDDGFSFIAMEYLDGQDLHRLVESQGPLAPARAVVLLAQGCRSLVEAHAAGIIHRDVKPANLVVTQDTDGEEVLKVVDFGIARLITDSDATRTQSVRGTPAYMAPECWAGGAADERSDVYALGATLFFMLVGHAPFAARHAEDLVRAHLLDEPPPPSTVASQEIPPELDAIVLRCLAKQPKARYRDAAALEEALETCVQHCFVDRAHGSEA